MSRFPVLLCVLLLIPLNGAAAVRQRPATGQGVLVMAPSGEPTTAGPATVPVYREPGVARMTTMTSSRIPPLAPLAGGVPVLAVLEKRGQWFRIAYDDADRSGWIQGRRFWQFRRWEDLLTGRAITLLPGLAKSFYLLRQEAADDSPAEAPVGDQPLQVMDVRGDWCRVGKIAGGTGWVRWRDRDGRSLIGLYDIVRQIER